MARHDSSSNVPYETMNTPTSIVSIRGKKGKVVTETPPNKNSQPRPWMFYFGLITCVVGSTLFLGSLLSRDWIHFTLPTGGREMSLKKRNGLIAHYGPFEACDYGGKCGTLWEMVPGLGEVHVRLTQAVFTLAACLYIIGVVLILLDFTLGFWNLTSCLPFCEVVRAVWRGLVATVFPEMVLPVAAVAGFVAMLLMGELKQSVILRQHQYESVGKGLYVCLFGVVITVFGILYILLNRFSTDNSRLAKYVYRLRRKQRAKHTNSQKPEEGGPADMGGDRAQQEVDLSAVTVGDMLGNGRGDQISAHGQQQSTDGSSPQRQWGSASGVMKELVTSEI